MNFLEKEKLDASKSQQEINKEMAEAEQRRSNLLVAQGAKRQMVDEEGKGNTIQQIRTKKSKGTQRTEMLEKEMEAGHQDTEKLVNAVMNMGNQMAGAIQDLANRPQVGKVETEALENRLSLLEAQNVRRDDILSQILGHVSKLAERNEGN